MLTLSHTDLITCMQHPRGLTYRIYIPMIFREEKKNLGI